MDQDDLDIGGGRGYSFSFADEDAYASVQNYFSPSQQWPVTAMTTSVWIRWTGLSPEAVQAFAFTLLARNDPNHFQNILNVVQKAKNFLPNFEVYAAQVTSFTPANANLLSSWTHVTITYNLTDLSVFYNGSLVSTTRGNSKSLRWADKTALFLGGSMIQQATDADLVSCKKSQRFYGWMDDLAFYNRVLSVDEIAKNWQQAVDTTDSSLFLYYNFDEGPGSMIIKNHGTIGSQGDLYNGQIMGSTSYLEALSQTLLPVKQALFSPGVPVIGASPSLPVVFAVDAGASARLRIACQMTATTTTAASLIPSQAKLVSLPSGSGKIYQIDLSQTRIITNNTELTNAAAEFWYYASTTSIDSPVIDSMQYSCVCNGATQKGTINVIVNPAVKPDPDISLIVISGTKTYFNLHGSLANPGLMKINITSLPKLGQLSQWNFEQPELVTLITKVATQVTNIINGIQYIPMEGKTGVDIFSYQLIHNGISSTIATVKLSIDSWDFPPIIPLSATVNPVIILNRKATSFNLPVKDYQQNQYLGVYIMSLPTKGTLYQRNPDGSLGAIIDRPFEYSFSSPSTQYANKVLNVSSFWGTSLEYNPIQTLGPKACFRIGDCTSSWSPLTLSGTGGFAKGCGQGLCFASDPNENYLKYGYTEYIELGFNTSVIVSQLINGENQGMGSVKNILAKDPLGNWMTLWTTSKVDSSIMLLYYEFSQYRTNTPDICQTPFFTNHIRYEIDTRDVNDWDEFDYFELQGLATVDPSTVNWYGKAKWDVIYVPHMDASGLDSFTYSATDCPGISRASFAQRWSPNVGTININIIPVGMAGTETIDPSKGITKLDLSIWSVNSTSSTSSSLHAKTFSHPFAFTIASLPPSSAGFLTDSKGASIRNAPYLLPDSQVWFNPVPCCTASTCTQDQLQQQQQTNNHTSFAYRSTDVNNKGPVSVSLAIVCPFVTITANTPTDVGIPIVIALSVFIFVMGIAYGLKQYLARREAARQQQIKHENELKEAAKQEMQQLQDAAKRAEEEAKKAEADQERERCLRHELEENIVNSAHDIKNPTTALGLAVDSLLDTFNNTEPITEAARRGVVETLHGMAHTIAKLNMIINRSVDSSSSASFSGRGFVPNRVPIHLQQLMEEVVAYSKWQAEDTGIEVILEPLPTTLPEVIMMDNKWLKDDLLCVASNCVKFSRSNQKVPALIRVAIVPSTTVEKSNLPNPSSVLFTFTDSGYPLPEESLTAIFNRPVHSERKQLGGMGLGLFCLSEHIKALQGQYGARRRSDGREGTEIWFSFPLVVPEADLGPCVMNDVDHINEHNTQNSPRVIDKDDGAKKPHAHAFFSPQNRGISPLQTPAVMKKATTLNGISVGANVKDGGLHEISSAGGCMESPFRSIKKSQLYPTQKLSPDRIQEVLGTMPILLVDDSVSILKLTKKAIQNGCANISFMEAKNGEEAFEKVVEAFASFKLIVTDIQMPMCDGFAFTRKVRQLEQDKGLPPKIIIGISANDKQAIAIEAEESGMDAFMCKPFKLSTLIDIIEDINDIRKQMTPVGSQTPKSPKGVSSIAFASYKKKEFDTNILKALEEESLTKERGTLLGQYATVLPTASAETPLVAIAPQKHHDGESKVPKESNGVGRGIITSMTNGSGRKIAPSDSFLNPFNEG